MAVKPEASTKSFYHYNVQVLTVSTGISWTLDFIILIWGYYPFIRACMFSCYSSIGISLIYIAQGSWRMQCWKEVRTNVRRRYGKREGCGHKARTYDLVTNWPWRWGLIYISGLGLAKLKTDEHILNRVVDLKRNGLVSRASETKEPVLHIALVPK